MSTAAEDPNVQKRSINRWRVVVTVILLLLLGLLLFAAQRDRARILDRLAATEADRDESTSAAEALSGQVEGMGGDPVVEVEQTPDGPEVIEVPGPQGEPGESGPGPSGEQVAAAVERYCEANGCIGPQGPAPTAIQVAAAVSEYCDDRGQCIGPAGGEGATGATGPAGESITGPRGPGPTGEQITAAVEAYCAERNGCSGPPGADGEDSTVPGPRGEPGPACPDGAEEIPWLVDEARSVVVGLPPDTYVLCQAAST